MDNSILCLIVVISLLAFLVWMAWSSSYESFGSGDTQSSGYYKITWDPPQNVDPTDPSLSYHLKISDTADNVIVDTNVQGQEYDFESGEWDTDYVVEVSASLADVGEGPSISQSFTSGDGVFSPDVTGLQLYGAGSMGDYPIDPAHSWDRGGIGYTFEALSVNFKTSDNSRLNLSGDTKISVLDVKLIRGNGDTCEMIINNPDLVQVQLEGLIQIQYYFLKDGCNINLGSALPPTQSIGCPCETTIEANDKITITLTFSNDYGDSTYSQDIVFDPVVPTAPESTSIQWVSSP